MREPSPILISNRYQIIDRLGVGGMGTVYRVQDRLTSQVIALKQVLVNAQQLQFASKTDSTDPRLLLAQEFKFLASLRHPHIINVLDYGFDDQGQPYYTMTLLEGAQEIAVVAGQRNLDGKVALLLQVLQALAYLHRRGILHRDLKPSNVMVNSDGQVKVVDFGLAVGVDQENLPAGTLVYMAPEVMRGQSATVQSDLYAVGVMAYELIVGNRPYDAEHPIALMYKVLHGPLNVEPLMIAPELVGIIQRLLAVTPEDRYATAEDVILAVAGAIGQPTMLETQATRESFLQAAHFVGRDAELALLNDALISATENRGSVWLIAGESGVGKSRLLDELQTYALLRGALVLRGQAIAEGGTPYQIWREAIRRLSLQTALTDFEATVLKPIVPDIDRLLSREVPDTPEIDAQSLQLRVLSVIESLFCQQQQLIVLLLEDLQWADDSLILLKRLNEVANQLPLLIISTYRSDERPTLPDELSMLRYIKMERLSSESIERLSVSMLGEIGKSEAVVDLLKRETEGNVFFIVEVMRTLAEEAGQLADIARKTLPDHVFAGGMRTVVRRRLDKVPVSARQLMTIAALVGRELDLQILHLIRRDLNIDEWLQQVAIVIEVQDNRYRFAHDKLRDGILDTLEPEDRRRFHKEIAQAIETAYPDAPEQYAALAYHWGQAQEAAKTIHNATLAGQQALRSGSYREAIKFFEDALTLTNQVQLNNKHLSNLHYLLGDAYWGQSDMVSSREWHIKALGLLGLSVPKAPGQLVLRSVKPLLNHLWRRAFQAQHQGDDHEALLVAARSFDQITQGSYHDANILLGLYGIFNGIDAAERAGNSPQAVRLQSRYYTSLGFAMGDIALHRIARSYFGLAQKRLRAETDPEALAWFGFPYAMYLAGRGQWAEANHHIEKATQLSQAAGSLRLWVQINEFRIFVYCLQSRFSDAIAVVESAGEIAIRDGHAQSIGRFHTARSRMLFLQGKTREAREHYFRNEAAIEAPLNFGDQTVSQIMVNGLLTDFHIRDEEWDEAIKCAGRLDSLITSAQTISFILAGEAAASIALYLTLWERHAAKSYRKSVDTMLKVYHRKFTSRYEIGHPVEYGYRGWYHWLNGDEKQARTMGALAIEAAQAYKMPYYEAVARFHLARFMTRDDPSRADHLNTAVALFERIGSVYDAQKVREAL